jgi:hypothetical protein
MMDRWIKSRRDKRPLPQNKAPAPQKQNLIQLLQVRWSTHFHGYHSVQGPTLVEICQTKPVSEENNRTVVQLWKIELCSSIKKAL